jgi:hypothetical protein
VLNILYWLGVVLAAPVMEVEVAEQADTENLRLVLRQELNQLM